MAARPPLFLSPLAPTGTMGDLSSLNTSVQSPRGGIFTDSPLGMVSPNRSLFNLTPGLMSSPTSLFAISPVAPSNNTPIAPNSAVHQEHIHLESSISSRQRFQTPLDSLTPPIGHNTSASAPQAPSGPRSITHAQRQLQITPSPFRAPSSSGTSLDGPSGNAPSPHTPNPPLTEQNPTFRLPQMTSVARVLQFDDAMNLPSIQRPKRPSLVEHSNSDPEMTAPPPKRTVPHVDIRPPPMQLATPELQSPTYRIAPIPSLRSPTSFAPPPSIQALHTTQSPAEPAQAPRGVATPAQIAKHNFSSNNTPQESPTTASTSHPHLLERVLMSSQPAATTTALVPRTAPPMPTPSPALAPISVPKMPSYSSYSAALAAQALLEDNAEDLICVNKNELVLETGAMAGALEALASSMAETASTINKLNWNLQLANNEILLMNSSMIVDERMSRLEDYFLGVNDD